MKFVPHPYQSTALAHLKAHPSAALLLDMGLGKTVVALTAIADLIDGLDLGAVLVVAPLRVVQMTWPEEIAKWDHTRHLKVSRVLGVQKERERALTEPADIYLMNYENVIWLAEWLSKNGSKRPAPFDMIVWDESSKMKSWAARRFKMIKPYLPTFKRHAILTGTPSPKSYLDLWSQYYLLDQGARLGKFITHYRDRHFEQGYDGWTYTLRGGHSKQIERAISDITLCLKAKDYLKMPKLIKNRVEVALPPKTVKQYKELEREMFLKLDSGEIEAMNAAALSNQCRQFVGGAVYKEQLFTPEGKPILPRVWHTVHNAKIDALADIIEDAQGSPVLVAFEFKHELARLRARWARAPMIVGGTSERDAAKAKAAWNSGTVPVMLVHPASVGHGLNLQAGGHILVWFTLTWSLELYEQTVARLYRQGQSQPVVVHSLVCRGTVDEAVAASIAGKAKGQAALISALTRYRKAIK